MACRSRSSGSRGAFSSSRPRARSRRRRIATMLDYDFMRTAFAAGAIVAIVAGTVGVFLVLRNLSFACHALSHVGFAGATGAALVGMSPLWGLVAFSLLGAAAMGLLGEKLRGRDVAVGIILSLALGCGVLFLHLYTAYASQATALLFGNVLGVGGATLRVLLALAIVSLAALAAIAVAEAAQVVGVLLVFALMVGPPAAALGLTTRLGHAVALSALLGLVETWAGIALAYVTDWPTSFWIVLLSCLVYFASLAARRIIALGSEGAAFP